MSKVLVITGASRGIGAATAICAAAEGWKVVTSYVERAEPAEAVVQAIRAAGGQAITRKADTTNEADIAALFDAAEKEFGPVTGAVNNAGIVSGPTTVADLPADMLRRMMEVNVVGAFFVAGEAVRRMSTKRGGPGGAIVNIASVAPSIGGSGEMVHYAASKAAVITMTYGLGKEVALEGIRVNCVSPGLIETEMNPPARLARLLPVIPIGRVGQADEVARVVCFLLSPAASYMVGANVVVGGGR